LVAARSISSQDLPVAAPPGTAERRPHLYLSTLEGPNLPFVDKQDLLWHRRPGDVPVMMSRGVLRAVVCVVL
jgi:hypothetical protein